MARTSRTVPRIGRIGSLVPSALIFWITVIILGECQPGVQGVCQIICEENSYCLTSRCSAADRCITPSFDESTDVDAVLFTVVTEPPGSEIRITMETENADSVFRVEGSNVLLNSSFDYESVKEYFFYIGCLDGDDWSTTEQSLYHQLKVEDVNDNEPYFEVTTIYAYKVISENTATGTVLITDVPIQAFDDDEIEQAFKYSIQENVPFNLIEPTPDGCQSGEVFLSLNEAIDFEDQEFYSFTLIAEDGCTTGLESLTGTVTVIVQVIDTDDEPPVFSQDNYIVSTPSSSPSVSSPPKSNSTVVGSAVGVIVVFVIVIVLIIIFYKRRSNESASTKSRGKESDSSPQYENPVFDQSQTDVHTFQDHTYQDLNSDAQGYEIPTGPHPYKDINTVAQGYDDIADPNTNQDLNTDAQGYDDIADPHTYLDLNSDA